MRCNHDNGHSFNACLSLDYRDYPGGTLTSGVDVYLPEYYVRAIVACGNSNFKSSLRGDDGKGKNDPVIRELSVVPGWPRADSTGIAAELIDPNLHNRELDDDEDDQVDELYARVEFYDCHTGEIRDDFTTGIIRGNFVSDRPCGVGPCPAARRGPAVTVVGGGRRFARHGESAPRPLVRPMHEAESDRRGVGQTADAIPDETDGAASPAVVWTHE